MKRAFLLLILLAVTLTVHAQDTPPTPRYRLRVPSVEEYLAAIPTVLAQWREDAPDYYDKNYTQPLLNAIMAQMWRWYTRDEVYHQSYSLLRDTYNGFKTTIDSPYQDSVDEPSWQLAQVEAWLRENAVDLNGMETLRTDGFYATVHPVDFDGDGVNEFRLEHNGHGWSADLILQADASHVGSYRVVNALHWYNAGWYKDIKTTEGFQDLTGDGGQEWIIERAEGGPGRYVYCRSVTILTWLGGKLESVMPIIEGECVDDSFDTLKQTYINLDDDPALELYQDEPQHNAWYCHEIIRYTLDWDGENYRIIKHETITTDSLGCALRTAESLMWEGRYLEAIPLYEEGLQAGWPDDAEIVDETRAQLEDYAQIRLSLAYALTGQMDTALQHLKSAAVTPSTSEALNTMITHLQSSDRQGVAWCTSAYHVWTEIERSAFTYPFDLIGIIVGYDKAGPNEAPDASKAGCDAPALIDALLSAHTFTLDTPPAEQLEALGIAIETTREVDLDGDGREEWLIWPVAIVNPIFFYPGESGYSLSRPPIRRDSQYTRLFTQDLPDEQGTAIVDWAYLDFGPNNMELYWYDMRDNPCQQKEQVKHPLTDGDVRLWQLADSTLFEILRVPMCTPRTPDVLFTNNGRELHAASYIGDVYRDSLYRWDSRKKTYVPPAYISAPEDTWVRLSSATFKVIIEPFYSPLFDGALFDAFDVMQLNYYDKGEYAAALVSLDNLIAAASPEAHHVIVNALHYWRGMTLEKLDRPDEALAEYVAIIEAAPESAWGRLAALHVEMVDE